MHGELSWNKVDGSKISEKLWCYDRQNRNHDYWLSQTIRNDNYIGSIPYKLIDGIIKIYLGKLNLDIFIFKLII